VSGFRGKILVIRGGAIGDFILTLPALAALRKQFPEAYIEVLGYPHIVQLAVAGGLVDKAAPIEARALAAFFASHGTLSEDMRDYFSEFDLIISYLYDPDLIFRTNVGRCTSAQFITAPHRPDEKELIAASRVYLRPLERLAIFDPDFVPRLALEPRLQSLDRVALHPGSGSETKNWPEGKWADLVEYLVNQTTCDLLFVGGEAEGERLQKLAAALPPARVRIAQGLPLPDLALLLQQCRLFLGHDSGISHLAAALDVPSLILWGPTVEEVWRPNGRRARILRTEGGLAELQVACVIQGVEALLAEHPFPA
jgi:heptosyltransferase-2